MEYQKLLLLSCLTFLECIRHSFTMDDVEVITRRSNPLQPVTLICRTNATRVIWQHKGRSIYAYNNGKSSNLLMNDNFEMIHGFSEERDLRIKSADKGNAGEYTCSSASRKTLVKYELVINEAAYISAYSDNQESEEFSTVGLWCNATGEPKPDITWYVVDENGDQEHKIEINGPYLEIRNITRGCDSRYRCKAKNDLNNDPVTKDITVTTVYKPEVDISLDEPEENVESFEFDNDTLTYVVNYKYEQPQKDIVLTCYFSASPEPSVSWLVGDQLIGIKESGQEIVDKTAWDDSYAYQFRDTKPGEMELHITVDRDDLIFSKPYKCLSENVRGTDYCSVQFKRYRP